MLVLTSVVFVKQHSESFHIWSAIILDLHRGLILDYEIVPRSTLNTDQLQSQTAYFNVFLP